MYTANDDINVIFEYLGQKYNIISKKEEFLNIIIEKFKNRIGDHKEELLFFYKYKALNSKKRLRDILSGNKKFIYINVHKIKNGVDGVGGFDCMNFTDLSKQIYEQLYFLLQHLHIERLLKE